MNQRFVRSVLLCMLPAIILWVPGCSNDHKEESRQLAAKLAEELIEQQKDKKPDSPIRSDNSRAHEIQAELLDAGLTADEVRLMLDSLQQQLTAAQQQDTSVQKNVENNNGKPTSTSH